MTAKQCLGDVFSPARHHLYKSSTIPNFINSPFVTKSIYQIKSFQVSFQFIMTRMQKHMARNKPLKQTLAHKA